MRPPQLDARRRMLKRERARELRSSATEPERRLWSMLRRKQMAGVRFRRQQTIGPYIVDFYCSIAKLVVELDADQHGEDRQFCYDEARTRWLVANNFRVLRCTNSEFLRDPQSVLDAIWQAVQESGVPLPRTAPRFDPPSRGGSLRKLILSTRGLRLAAPVELSPPVA